MTRRNEQVRDCAVMPAARRRFLLMLAAGGAVALTARRAAAELTPLAETDPTAQALGYKIDAAQVDAAKSPRYAAGQNCSNCKFFQAGASATCQLFPGKSVSAAGWCSAYAAKAA